MIKTCVCKIIVPLEKLSDVENTLKAFQDACNFIAEYGKKHKVFHRFALHKHCYKTIREKYFLPADMTTKAINRSSLFIKRSKANCLFKTKFADFDDDLFSIKDEIISLRLIGAREKFQLDIGDYQRNLLKDAKPKFATLFKKGDDFFIGICIKIETLEAQEKPACIGVDLGLRNIAVTSTEKIFSGTQITATRLKQAKVVRSLQSKASKGKLTTRKNARKALQRLKGRTAKFQRWVNHNISKTIVDDAIKADSMIALEDLKGIRARMNKKLRRKHRGLQNSWAFYQLRQYISYKAEFAGVPLKLVNPAYTSQTCSICGVRGKRTALRFACTSCGISHADINAAKNISQLGLSVFQPEKSVICV